MSFTLTATKNKHGRESINWSLDVQMYRNSLAQLGFNYTGLKIIAYMRNCLPNAEIFKFTRMNGAVARSTAAEAVSISYLGSMYMFSI